MIEPVYNFTLPSIGGDMTLEGRLYHPPDLSKGLCGGSASLKGAILAHPYAPLGGCFDDHVVLSLANTMLSAGFIVGTFNFRGAGNSKGKTTWSGRAETEDYTTFIGFMMHYLHQLKQSDLRQSKPSDSAEAHELPGLRLLLGGYSYGSLVLARLPPVSAIVARFERALEGTASWETMLRASSFAHQTLQTLEDTSSQPASRGRNWKPEDATSDSPKRAKASPVVVGGEETEPMTRRHSRDSKRSADLVRVSAAGVARRILPRVRRSSDLGEHSRWNGEHGEHGGTATGHGMHLLVPVNVSYLIASPVVLPFTTLLCPPGPPSVALSVSKSSAANGTSGSLFLQHPTLAVFGTTDSFTSSRRLRSWAEKQAQLSKASSFRWRQVGGAGHFWTEDGAMRALQAEVADWLSVVL
ncbi:hypothetical protein BAUCODRAFT_124120 [Baudoinia panamericana UAMH 10762]|uniref:AB hydrolase-1 domain-containing protein n=1 Tax=Baudoinia panamericana (strain UAMH 10762) TaxID=717646 RepID=M2MDB5_BAUPA|nr:uncharacterized protein BAUCODRAFT_124120 [Baudoinia panamericana UAMH 10762]EMC94501.1 hypothetical protein BAUCODRAFT_124120 [Baudoinia panamericana UAMH 10762]